MASTISAHISKYETDRTLLKPPKKWGAYEACLMAAAGFSLWLAKREAADLYEIRRRLRHALSLDPDYARAHAMLALTYVTSYVQPVDKDYRSQWALRRAIGLTRRAIALDPLLPHAHNAHGNALTFLGRIEAAIQAHEKAISLNRNIIDWRYGGTLLRGGYRERAIEVLERYMLLDPFHHPTAVGLLGLAQFQEREYEKALPLLRECVLGLPDHRIGHGWLAATYVKLGRMKEARSEALEVLRIEPGYRVSTARREPNTLFATAPDADHYFTALRKAGVPD